MVTLNFLASGSYQRRVGQDFLHALCQTSVSVSVKQVIRAVNQHLIAHWIKFPITEEARQRNKERYVQWFSFTNSNLNSNSTLTTSYLFHYHSHYFRFMATRNFAGVIGCVDGTHIAIVSPVRAREHLFHNRKGYHSKNVQIVSIPTLESK
jgi:hypothetical protein